MPSQKSSAVEPKRARGRARVEAILLAASRVFAEQGYDLATMTEIAARSSTAIGSLYRFFPTKELLGEALMRRYLERSSSVLDELADQTPSLARRDVAAALIEATTGTRADELRAGTLAVLEGRGDLEQLRRDFRARRRKQIARILRLANPALEATDAQDRATVILYLLKGERTLAEEEPSAGRRLAAEIRRLVTSYIDEAMRAHAR
jgi:AcrR family transcriptional regulator